MIDGEQAAETPETEPTMRRAPKPRRRATRGTTTTGTDGAVDGAAYGASEGTNGNGADERGSDATPASNGTSASNGTRAD